MADSLNVQIAKKLGWRVEEPEAYGMTWRLYAPDSTQVNTLSDYGEALAETEAEAWSFAPDFEHSLDASVAVIPVSFAVLIRAMGENQYEAWITDDAEPRYLAKSWHGSGATRAEALANALSAMLETGET